MHLMGKELEKYPILWLLPWKSVTTTVPSAVSERTFQEEELEKEVGI